MLSWRISIQSLANYTHKTGIPVEEGDSILKLLWRVCCPGIQLGWAFMEFTFQVSSKLLTFSRRKLSTSSFILNFLECSYIAELFQYCQVLSSGPQKHLNIKSDKLFLPMNRFHPSDAHLETMCQVFIFLPKNMKGSVW